MPKTYKDFVFSQNANGSWKEQIIQLMGEASFEDFVNRQQNEEVKSLEKVCLLTLAGIKVLTERYPESKSEWRLVVHKAYGFLALKLSKNSDQITQLVQLVNVL